MDTLGNCWDTITVFNQHTLKNVLGGRRNIVNPNLHVTVNCMTDQQKLDAIMFLKEDAEGLADLPDGRGLQAVVEVQALLAMLPTPYNFKQYIITPELAPHMARVEAKHD